MNAIVLTKTKPASAEPVSVSDLRLETEPSIVSAQELVSFLGSIACAKAYAESVKKLGVAVCDTTIFGLQVAVRKLFYGVLSEKPFGPNGHSITYYKETATWPKHAL